MPIKSTEIGSIEKLQKDFLCRIPAIRELNYWEQLERIKMLSLQRRLERYRIIYIWKTLEGLAPNCGIQSSSEEGRLGRKCIVPIINTKARQSVQSKKEQTFQVNGPQLFNSLPIELRNIKNCALEDFKYKLDQWLERVPDEPNVRGLTPGGMDANARASNSIVHQAKRIHMGPNQMATTHDHMIIV